MQDPATKAPPVPTSPPSRSSAGPRTFVLRFISGKYQGGEFPIVADKPIIVGRSSELDMVLVEDMVSRKHARIQLQQEQIWIEDLGSTNGTFVNGEKIKRARLKEGDRVLIGTSILKVIASEQSGDTIDGKSEFESFASRRSTQARTMSGSIEEVPLPDLLQLFSTSKKSGVLVVRTEREDIGRIYMRKGVVYFASINELDDVPPTKCIFRMLTWEKGLFDLEPPDERSFPNEISLGVQELLMEGLRQIDEVNELKKSLPEMTARLAPPQPLTVKLRDLTPEELDVFQLVLSYGHLEAVLNRSPASDLDTMQVLVKLVNASYLRAE